MKHSLHDDRLDWARFAIDALAEEHEALRILLVELRDQVQRPRGNPVGYGMARITSLPLDPTGDWSGQVNAVPEEVIEMLRSMKDRRCKADARERSKRRRANRPSHQRNLW